MSSFISSIGTAVPKNRLSQKTIGEFMLRHLGTTPEIKRTIELMYRASGISYRHSVLSDFGKTLDAYSFFPKDQNLDPFPTVSKRMQLYKREALLLAKQAVDDCLPKEQLSDITHLITVSCTGMYAPGLDIELIEEVPKIPEEYVRIIEYYRYL